MKKSLKLIGIVALLFVLAGSILHAKVSGSSASKRKVFVEILTVQISNDALTKLQIGNQANSLSKVTVSLPVLLHVLSDPKSVKTIASAKINTLVGETGRIDMQKKIEYLLEKDDGSFERNLTSRLIGVKMSATPTIDRQGKIQLKYDYENMTLNPPRKKDTETSLRIGKPVVSSQKLTSIVKLRSGEPMIIASSSQTDSKSFTLVWAEILENKANDASSAKEKDACEFADTHD